ncbi:peptidase family M13 [Streptococcus downei F0415]|uniref:Neutral endopeptidase n=2 Tax=Streptococcus downei TaxID=1317 RepID=A0A380JI46_STRDO|nr:peptidase family M13 [Streptococcus downei F0415]SUN37368.1 neutral endopeptidase [Streptococcus downei MFe28]
MNYFKQLDTIINDQNLEKMKAWMIANLLIDRSDVLGQQNRQVASAFQQATSGTTKIESKEKNAYTHTSYTFGHVLGDYYGKKYFGQQARQDVTKIAKNIIASYKKRLNANTWLSQETKAMAIKKLDNLKLMIGYPETYSDLYRNYQVDPTKSFFENDYNYHVLSNKMAFSEFNKLNDREEWKMSANAVNAYYNPNTNAIIFPAAVLQAPFFSKENTISQNYGGIGAIIGHEISHSFDINGMKYDENGNLHDWWTKKDLAMYKKKTRAMVKQWDGLKADGGKVDGKATLAENIADNGGVMVALETLKKEKAPNYKEFFYAWASIWRQKATKEYGKFSVESDAHAPYELRANIPVRNFKEYYDTFDVKKGDPMYLPENKRITIW